jgi:GNAT superfamily N-acetyltransferase
MNNKIINTEDNFRDRVVNIFSRNWYQYPPQSLLLLPIQEQINISEVKIKPAIDKQIKQLSGIYLKCFPLTRLTKDIVYNQFIEFKNIIVAKYERKVIGGAIWNLNDLEYLMVIPEYQGQGVGSKMFDYFILDCINNHFDYFSSSPVICKEPNIIYNIFNHSKLKYLGETLF